MMLEALCKGAIELGLELSEKQLKQLVELQNQLLKWNKTYNLTAITNADESLKLHLLDSLSVVPFWSFNQTLDVGTGAGFPGLPLAIALPEKEFHLLDSNSKKIRFIRQQIHALGLTNVVAHHNRVQQHQLAEYDCVVSRAFASLADMVNATEALVKNDGRWMAMKGAYLKAELSELPSWVKEVRSLTIKVPGLNADRCLIELARRND